MTVRPRNNLWQVGGKLTYIGLGERRAGRRRLCRRSCKLTVDGEPYDACVFINHWIEGEAIDVECSRVRSETFLKGGGEVWTFHEKVLASAEVDRLECGWEVIEGAIIEMMAQTCVREKRMRGHCR